MRRFELSLGPLLARLGYTRPDEDPLQSADLVQPVLLVAPPSYGAPSPGSRVCWQSAGITTAQVIATGPGRFGAVFFEPPAGGGWLRAIFSQTDAGSFSGWATENEIATGFVLTIGTFERSLRPDSREPYPNLVTSSPGTVPAYPVVNRQGQQVFNPPTWWQGTTLFCVCSSADEGMTATVEFEPALEGLRRQTL